MKFYFRARTNFFDCLTRYQTGVLKPACCWSLLRSFQWLCFTCLIEVSRSFFDGRQYMDLRIFQLFGRWGTRHTRRISGAMPVLAFLYRGLIRFCYQGVVHSLRLPTCSSGLVLNLVCCLFPLSGG